jgi:Glycosyl hydrolases family 28/Pectate lyase superfamily protein
LILRRLCIAVVLSICLPAFADATPVCNVRDFGAKGDGVTLDTGPISAAIAACVRQGGGTVYVPPGRFVMGTVQLFSHIRLFLESGAVLVGSHDIHDYGSIGDFGFDKNYGTSSTGEGEHVGLLVTKNAEDVSIEGHGEIDGEGDSFMQMTTPHMGQDYETSRVRDPAKFTAAMERLDYGPVEPAERPGTMIVFMHAANIQLRGITLRASPNWTLHLQDVSGAVISGIQILNDPRVPNNDGIDCMMCRNVRVSDCDIQTGDDDFAIVNSEHVNVSNCSMTSRSAAIRLESTKLSTFTGLSMDTNRGIAVFASARAAQPTEDIVFADIVMRTRLIPGHWWGKAEPIYIAVQPCAGGEACGVKVHNVSFTNITAEAESGALLWGAAGSAISGVDLDGVRLHMVAPNPEFSASVGGNLDLRWTAASAKEGIASSEIPGIYAKHVEGLRLRDVRVDWAAGMPEYFSDGVRVENFQSLTIDDLGARQAQNSSGSAIALSNGSGVSITNSRALPGTRVFLQLDKVTGRRVFVNYDLKGAALAIEPASQRFYTQIGAPVCRAQTVKH